MIKAKLDFISGRYHATLLNDDEAHELEDKGFCIVEIPNSKALEWGEMQTKMEEWHHYWRQLDNEWYDKNKS